MDVPSPPRAATAPGSSYVFTRFVLLRLLGLVYAVAFLILDPPAGPAARSRRHPSRGSLSRRGARELRLDGRTPRRSCRRSSGSTPRTATRQAAAWVGLRHVARRPRRRHQRARSSWHSGRSTSPSSRSGSSSTDTAGRPSSARRASSRSSSVRCADPTLRVAAAARGHLALPLADRAHHARRRAHQAARRSVLARSHVPRLPLRDPAGAEPAQLVAPRRAARVPHGRHRVQPRRRARRALAAAARALGTSPRRARSSSPSR